MEKNLDNVTKPCYSERILPAPWPFVISRFHGSVVVWYAHYNRHLTTPLDSFKWPFLNCLFPRLVVIRKVLLYQTISLFLEIREQSNLSGTFPPKILIKLYYARSPLQWLLIIFFWCDRSVDANKSSVLDDFFSDSFPYQGKNNIRKLIVKYYPLISTAYIARFLSHNVCYTPTLNKAH